MYTGFNTEETPTIIEAAAFKDGIVIVQVNEVVDSLPRVDIPGDWVDVVVKADKPYQLEALFTRDPQNITELQILMAMMAIKRNLRRTRRTIFESRYWIQYSSYRIVTANLS